jgi:hypothetical protein
LCNHFEEYTITLVFFLELQIGKRDEVNPNNKSSDKRTTTTIGVTLNTQEKKRLNIPIGKEVPIL